MSTLLPSIEFWCRSSSLILERLSPLGLPSTLKATVLNKMKAVNLTLLLGLTAVVAGIPITPAAPEHQQLVEKLRSEGIAEVCFTYAFIFRLN